MITEINCKPYISLFVVENIFFKSSRSKKTPLIEVFDIFRLNLNLQKMTANKIELNNALRLLFINFEQ